MSSSKKCYISILYKLGILFCVRDKDSWTHDLFKKKKEEDEEEWDHFSLSKKKGQACFN